MISIKSIDLHIGNGRSAQVCIAKRLRIYCIGSVMFVRSTVGGRLVGLVLVFAATCREMALRSVS